MIFAHLNGLAEKGGQSAGCNSALKMLQYYTDLEPRFMDLSIKGVPDEQMARLRELAKANHRSLQGELRAIIDRATGIAPRPLSVDEIAAKVSRLGLTRRDEAARLIREDRDR
jgi:plasmid stability protein